MNDMASKIKHKNSTTNTWQIKPGKFKTNDMEKVDFCLLKSSVTKTVTWKCHVDGYTESRYNMILGQDLITTLVRGIKFYGDGTYEGFSTLMVDVNDHEFKYLTDKNIKLEEYFIN